MQALVIDEKMQRQDRSLVALMEAGFLVTGTHNLAVAETCLLRMSVDVLIIDRDTLGDALGDTLGFAEERNPRIISVLRTPDVAGDLNDLPEHFPSLHCVLGHEVSQDMALQLAMASLAQQVEEAEAQTIRAPASAKLTASVSALISAPEETPAAVPDMESVEDVIIAPWRSRFRQARLDDFAAAS